jgi:hypothetical protein
MKTIKDFYQSINDLQIDGYNAPIKLFLDGEEFFIKDITLKNNEVNGTFCSIELKSDRASLKDNLAALMNFVDKTFDENDFKEIDDELKVRAIEGIKRIKKTLNA